MRQTELHLSESERQAIEDVRSKGLHRTREVYRAHILVALDRQVTQAAYMEVLGVERLAIWCTRAASLAGGPAKALYDKARLGRPCEYAANAEARVTALARLGAIGKNEALDDGSVPAGNASGAGTRRD